MNTLNVIPARSGTPSRWFVSPLVVPELDFHPLAILIADKAPTFYLRNTLLVVPPFSSEPIRYAGQTSRCAIYAHLLPLGECEVGYHVFLYVMDKQQLVLI